MLYGILLEITEPLARMLDIFTFGKVSIKSSIFYLETTELLLRDTISLV